MKPASFERARRYAEQRLEAELSPDLHYHGIRHTRDEVVPAAELFASVEGIKGNRLLLLRTAAWFHDLGYVEGAVYHELISARMAEQVLPSFGYRDREVEVVRWAILATALPQSPNNLLEQILTDADLDVLGRENYMQRNNDLRRELACLDKHFSDEQWFRNQLNFIEGHRYFTDAAHSLRDAQKTRNILDLKKIMAENRWEH